MIIGIFDAEFIRAAVLCCVQYGIKKKEVPVVTEDPGLEGRLGRKKKTPEELAAEANTDPEEAAAQS